MSDIELYNSNVNNKTTRSCCAKKQRDIGESTENLAFANTICLNVTQNSPFIVSKLSWWPSI